MMLVFLGLAVMAFWEPTEAYFRGTITNCRRKEKRIPVDLNFMLDF